MSSVCRRNPFNPHNQRSGPEFRLPSRCCRNRSTVRILRVLFHESDSSLRRLVVEDDVDPACQGIVLELVEGETLADQIARGPFRILVALEVAQQIAAAIEAAHAKGIVHRDLNPRTSK
jgi:serine/threonine protein kinase